MFTKDEKKSVFPSYGFGFLLGKNTSYGSSKKIEIFTNKDVDDPMKRSEYNLMVRSMLDSIGTLYGGTNTPFMVQLLIHDKTCRACKENMPYWDAITFELQKRLLMYAPKKVELGDRITEDNGLTGYDILEMYDAHSIPFIIQNFEIKSKKFRNVEKNIVENKEWILSYVGKIHPFGFLSEIFKVPNLWLKSRNPYSTNNNF